ncbi:general secretion pathway protein L [Enterobacter cloacae]|uniref:General secretion pathway protein L n=1 Tax=Enterobacter cloacae TaxID=550 RepID=A0A377M307_ENTCL|nr:general secretion pathway protein L [Enterobacter cloacae]
MALASAWPGCSLPRKTWPSSRWWNWPSTISPRCGQTTNLKYHFGQNIKKEKKGIFLQLDALEQIKQSLPAVELSEVGYDDTQNQLTLNIRSMDPTALQAFVNKASDTFDFTLQPVSSEAPYTRYHHREI